MKTRNHEDSDGKPRARVAHYVGNAAPWCASHKRAAAEAQLARLQSVSRTCSREVVVGVYREDEYGERDSGTAWDALLNDIDRIGIDVVMVANARYLWPAAVELLDVYDALRLRGVDLKAVNPRVDTRLPSGRIFMEALAIWGRPERRSASDFSVDPMNPTEEPCDVDQAVDGEEVSR